jgi:hypothetical protein
VKIMEKYGYDSRNYPSYQLLRLRQIDDEIHGLKQKALTLMGF